MFISENPIPPERTRRFDLPGIALTSQSDCSVIIESNLYWRSLGLVISANLMYMQFVAGKKGFAVEPT